MYVTNLYSIFMLSCMQVLPLSSKCGQLLVLSIAFIVSDVQLNAFCFCFCCSLLLYHNVLISGRFVVFFFSDFYDVKCCCCRISLYMHLLSIRWCSIGPSYIEYMYIVSRICYQSAADIEYICSCIYIVIMKQHVPRLQLLSSRSNGVALTVLQN